MTKLRKIALALRTIILMFALLTTAQLVSAPSKAAGDWDWGVEFRTWYFADPERTIFVGYYVYNTCTGVETGDGEHTVYYEQIYDDIYCPGLP